MLIVVRDTKQNFKAPHIINVLTGNPTEEVLAHGHDDLDCYASGDDKDARHWNAVIRQALLSGYIFKEVENYGLIKLTPEGLKAIKSPKTFYITEDNDFDTDFVEPEGGTSTTQRPTQACGEGKEHTALRCLPRPVSRGYGDHVSHYHR